MTRKETTKFLSDLLRSRLTDRKYYATEVSLDAHTNDVKRIDFMQFEPAGVVDVADIEKGIFTCYEIKSCKADFESGYGKNFIGEKNYYVMTMETYKKVVGEIKHGIGCMVAIPLNKDELEEFENPTPIDGNTNNWKLKAILHAHKGRRKKSMVELLFLC